MTLLVYAAMTLGALVCACACVARAVWYARSPIHLRWELYPVPHESPDRVRHGGSYFESSEWWAAPRTTSLRGELAVMVPEVLLLHALRTFNRGLWRRSFPFHFGLYLLIATALGLLAMAVVTLLAGGGWAAGTTGRLLLWSAGGVGWLGLALAIGGAVALLHRRWADPALRTYTTAGDIFNLLFFVVALGALAAGYLARPAGSPGLLDLLVGLLSWNLALTVPPLLALGVMLAAALVAYIPLTHMAHFIGKYFTYHAVRWDDAPAGGNVRMGAALAEYLTYRPTWSAPHIKRPGTPTWAEVVTTDPTREGER